MNRESWLEPARRQAHALVEARLAQPRPGFVVPRRTVPLLSIVLGVALVASGAWAWTRTVTPQVLTERPVAAPDIRRPQMPRVVPQTVVAPRTVEKRRSAANGAHEAVAPVEQRVDRADFDEPLVDVVEGKPPSRLPPLFDVSEYKSRGVMVKESP